MGNNVSMLLQEIQKCAACAYLSELHTIIFDHAAQDKINAIPEERYTVEEWNEAVAYILGVTCDLPTIGEIRQKLYE